MRKMNTAEVLAVVPIDKGLKSKVILKRYGNEMHTEWLKSTTSQVEAQFGDQLRRTTKQLEVLPPMPQEEFPTTLDDPAFPTGVVSAIPKRRLPRVRFALFEIIEVPDAWHVWIFPGFHVVIPK